MFASPVVRQTCCGMELAPPRSLIDAHGQLTSFVQQQVPQRISYGANHQAFYPSVPQAMNGPFKFFVQTPAHFLPDPNSPVSTQGVYQSMGVQASLSPAAFTSMGSPVVYAGMPQAQASTPFGSYVITDPQGMEAAPTVPMPPTSEGLQLPAPARGVTTQSAFTDVSPAMLTPLAAAGIPQGQGTTVVLQQPPPGEMFASAGSPVMSGVPVPAPAGWVQGPAVGTPMSAGVPAALMSGVSGVSPVVPGAAGSPVYPVGAGTPIVAGSPNRFGMSSAAAPQAQRAETEITLKDLDGTATMGTSASGKAGKSSKRSQKKANRCLCF